MNKINNYKIFYFVILFILSIFISNQYLNKFENKLYKYGNYEYSSLLQEDGLRYIKEAEKIRIDTVNKKNFLISGGSYKFSFLYPRIIYFFNKIINQNKPMVGNNFIQLENYKILIFFQILIFTLSLIFLFKVLREIFEYRLSSIIVTVLFLNPIIFQFHLSLFTESLFLSSLIFTFCFLLKSKNSLHFFLLGIFVGILYMLRTIAILYPLVMIIYLIIIKKKYIKLIIYSSSLISGLIIILLLIGMHNYLRAGIFYFTPIQTKIDFETYMVPNILVKSKKLNQIQLKDHWDKRSQKIFERNDFAFSKEFKKLKPREYLILRSQKILKKSTINLANEKEMVLFFNELRNESFKTISDNKIVFLKIIIKNYFHSTLLNPVQVYFDAKYESWEDYKDSSDHQLWLKIRVIITILFLSLSLWGFLISIKKINFELNALLFFSILYFFITSCWLIGQTRYFVPSVMFLSFYFSLSLDKICLNFIKTTLKKVK